MGGKSARAKGTRGETELIQILNEFGIPSMRVLGSGSFLGAKSDLKIGVKLNKDGTMPDKDEGVPLLRAEVKNRKDAPDHLYEVLRNDPIAILESARKAPEYLYDYLNQDKISKCAIMKRAKTPSGALKNKDYNQTHLVFMGLEDFMEMIKELYERQ